MIIEDAWQGGRFDATRAERAVAVRRIIASGCTVAGMSEAKDLRVPAGWEMHGDESRVFFDTSVWTPRRAGTIVIRTGNWRRGASERDTVEFPWVPLVHPRSKVRLLRAVGHFPAHLTDPDQKAANTTALKALPERIAALMASTGADECSLSMDLNRDLRLKRNQDLVRRSFKGTGLHLVIPPKGTYGQRKIDCFLVTTGLYVRHMLAPAKGFDHQGWWLRYHGERR